MLRYCDKVIASDSVYAYFTCLFIDLYLYKGKGKELPLQARCGPEGG